MAKAPAGVGYPTIQEIRANPVVPIKKQSATTELALDLSSSCVGWALGHEKKPVRFGKFVFKSTSEIGEKLHCFECFLQVLLDVFRPERLLVEKTLTRRGSTTLRHAEILGVVRKVWFGFSGKEILDSWIISSKTVKRVMNVARGADHDENKKIMVNKINQVYRLQLRYHKNSAIQSDDDTADAIAVLTTYWRSNSRGR